MKIARNTLREKITSNPRSRKSLQTHHADSPISTSHRSATLSHQLANPSHWSANLSHQSETHVANLKPRPSKIPRKMPSSPWETPSPINKRHHRHTFVEPCFSQQQVKEWERVDEKTETKTKTKPKLKQRHQSKPIKKKSPPKLSTINPTNPPTD